MIKRISVRQLRLGMFLECFCGSWMEHPFWRSRFKLEDPADLARILHSPIQEVWIDTAKGLDVEQGGPSRSREQGDTVIDAQLSETLSPRPAPSHFAKESPCCTFRFQRSE